MALPVKCPPFYLLYWYSTLLGMQALSEQN